MLNRLKSIFGFGQEAPPAVVVNGAIETGDTRVADAPVYPIGKIDFNTPFVVIDEFDDKMEDAEVVAVLENSTHPVVVSFWDSGRQRAASFNLDGDSEDFGYRIVSDDEDDDSDEIYVNGLKRNVGDTVRTYRRGFGYRNCTIVKMRDDPRKSLYVNPNDGNKCYWALNKNVT